MAFRKILYKTKVAVGCGVLISFSETEPPPSTLTRQKEPVHHAATLRTIWNSSFSLTCRGKSEQKFISTLQFPRPSNLEEDLQAFHQLAGHHLRGCFHTPPPTPIFSFSTIRRSKWNSRSGHSGLDWTQSTALSGLDRAQSTARASRRGRRYSQTRI